ncbi:hypothetical protein AJ80_06003 [Polytolypa hystricis UAMH7299]|uniref:Uncharacterized protein n=1 Tax=Polytolypa hystricis (strain UAMH7299) TaxID=1447883 RepID=A0A2B7XZQ5_POLH7|nr:hypothetical protein AJ80_06003 [Polytolypa hystricis UAMH7299]
MDQGKTKVQCPIGLSRGVHRPLPMNCQSLWALAAQLRVFLDDKLTWDAKPDAIRRCLPRKGVTTYWAWSSGSCPPQKNERRREQFALWGLRDAQGM